MHRAARREAGAGRVAEDPWAVFEHFPEREGRAVKGFKVPMSTPVFTL